MRCRLDPAQVSAIEDAMAHVASATAALGAVLREQFPIGADVAWKVGKVVYFGVVVGHGSFAADHIEVMSERSLNTRWVTLAALLEAQR